MIPVAQTYLLVLSIKLFDQLKDNSLSQRTGLS